MQSLGVLHRELCRASPVAPPPRAPCHGWPKHIAKCRQPRTCLQLTILLSPSPPPLPSSSLSLSLSARTRGGARRPGRGEGGAQDAFADTLCYYFNTIIRKVQARPRQPPPRPHPLRPPQLSCMLLLLRPSHLRRRFGSSRIRFLCAVVGG